MSSELSTHSTIVPEARREGDAVVAKVEGEVDLNNSTQVRVVLLSLLTEQQPSRLVVDLADVPYMDSSAIAVFVETKQKLMGIGGELRLACLQPRVQGLLEIARLDEFLGVRPDVEKALGD